MTQHTTTRQPYEREVAFDEVMAATIACHRANVPDDVLSDLFGPQALSPAYSSWAPCPEWKHWCSQPHRLGDLPAMLLFAQPEAKDSKRLPLFSPTRLIAAEGNPLLQRVQPHVHEVHYAVGDFDRNDATFDLACARMVELGTAALVYRSPSDGTTVTRIRRCNGPPGNGPDLVEPTIAGCRAWFEREGYQNISGLEIINPAHTVSERRRVKDEWVWVPVTYIVVRHDPLTKLRVVVPLAKGLVREATELVPGGARRFQQRIADGVLRPLMHHIGFYPDPKTFDSTRAFFMASSLCPSAQADPAIELSRWIPGEYLDPTGDRMSAMRAAYVEPRRQQLARQKAETAKRVEVMKASGAKVHGERYLLADLVAEHAPSFVDRDKRDEKGGLLEAQCPFAEEHSNGDPHGFWVTNHGIARCHHAHGDRNRLPAEYIAKMLAEGWVTETQLAEHRVQHSSQPTLRALTSWFGR